MNNNINVNMTPNPLDLQRLECSQFDTTPRQFQFTLHNQGETYDLSNISDPVFTSFPVHVGGTEELLPSNTGTPTTSPIKADIQYPDGIREGEEFTYRESPAIQDGLARIDKIKGNTLVWNQLMEHGNFDTAAGFATSNLTDVSVSDGVFSGVCNNPGNFNVYISRAIPTDTNHKIFIAIDVKCIVANSIRLRWPYVSSAVSLPANTWYRFALIVSPNSNYNTTVGVQMSGILDATYQFKNYMCIDLTQMFGAGNEPTTVEEFTAMFPLPYYAYDSGSLLSFMGTGIKTNGFNQFDEQTELGGYSNSTGEKIANTGQIRSVNAIRVFPNEVYYVKCSDPIYLYKYGVGMTFQGYWGTTVQNQTITIPSDCYYLTVGFRGAYGTSYKDDVCINISNDSKNGTYESYKESTTNLPVLTYFPTGMKSAGSVYDELTPSKAITRIGAVDLGSLPWAYNDVSGQFYVSYANFSNMAKPANNNTSANILCSKYITKPSANRTDKSIVQTTVGNVIAVDSSFTNDSAEFKASMSGVYLYYELLTESEQSITSASLVTESAEIPLYVSDDMLVGDCTEELTSEAGYHVAKIRFTDSDGSNYSNKIQLHVERSPQ